MFSSNCSLYSLDDSGTLESWQPFIVPRIAFHGAELSPVENKLPQKFFFQPSHSIHHLPTSLFIPIVTRFPCGPLTPYLHFLTVPSVLSQASDTTHDQTTIRGPRWLTGSQIQQVAFSQFLNFLQPFDTMASFYVIHFLYFFGFLPISLSPLGLLSPVLLKCRDSPLCGPLLCAILWFHPFSCLFWSPLCTRLLNIDFESQLNSRIKRPFAFGISPLDLLTFLYHFSKKLWGMLYPK